MKTAVLTLKAQGDLKEIKDLIEFLEQKYSVVAQSRFKPNQGCPGVHVFLDLKTRRGQNE